MGHNHRFLFTCGGTAGHINPAIGVAGRIKALLPDAEILFVGAAGNMETELVPREGYPIRTITVSNVHRSFAPAEIWHNIKTVVHLASSAAQARRILRDFQPQVAIGTGGYVCYPVIRQAAKLGIPAVIHESNAVPGLTTKMLSSVADRILVGFEASRTYYKRQDAVCVTGTPVREAFLNCSRASAREAMGIPQDRKLVVSFWGSLGAFYMNEIMEEFIRRNEKEQGFFHIHATGDGKQGMERMHARLTGVKLERTDLRPYIYDMPQVMAAADVILCRAGASTLSELTVLGKPAILVPSPYVTNNHQEKNARVLEQGGGALVLTEPNCTGSKLYEQTLAILNAPDRLSQMAANMRAMGSPDATEKIVDVILGLL